MANALNKVKRGDPLTMSAATFNAFVEAARDYQDRALRQGSAGLADSQGGSRVLVKNDSGGDRARFQVLGIDAPIVAPATNLEEFKNRVALSCVTPVADTHEGKFVVLAEPIAAGKIGRAYVAGICPVQIMAVDAAAEAYPYADIYDGYTDGLFAVPHGSASILWRESGTSLKWAVVRIGNPVPPNPFAVDLMQVGGSQGTETTAASWTYDVLDMMTGQTLASGVDPTAAPHKWQRPSVGWMIPATFGYAHYVPKDPIGFDLVLGWINEMADQEACSG